MVVAAVVSQSIAAVAAAVVSHTQTAAAFAA